MRMPAHPGHRCALTTSYTLQPWLGTEEQLCRAVKRLQTTSLSKSSSASQVLVLNALCFYISTRSPRHPAGLLFTHYAAIAPLAAVLPKAAFKDMDKLHIGLRC